MTIIVLYVTELVNTSDLFTRFAAKIFPFEAQRRSRVSNKQTFRVLPCTTALLPRLRFNSHAGIQPDPGMELARAVAGESKPARAHPQRVGGVQRWIVAGKGLVEVDGHRPWRGNLRSYRVRGNVPFHRASVERMSE